MLIKTKLLGTLFLITTLIAPAVHAAAKTSVTPEEARAIAKEAYIYANPLVDSYRIMYGYFVDRQNPEFKAPWNQIKNIPRVYTHEDRAVQSPNSDTPYSGWGWICAPSLSY